MPKMLAETVKEWNNFISNFIAVTTLESQVNPNVCFFIRLSFKCCMKLINSGD